MPSKMAGNKGLASSPPSSEAGSSMRLQRNLAEKQRRDKLNGYISELATIVPMVSMASKRLDKTSILRLSAAHLRIYQSFLSGQQKCKSPLKWRPNFFSGDQIQEILESVEGFLLVMTTTGKIMYVSQTVEKFLGHQNIEMIGHPVFSFVHSSDVETVRSQLEKSVAEASQNSGNSRCSFYCRLRERNQPRSEVMTYQFVHIVGHVTIANNSRDKMEEDQENAVSVPSNGVLKAFIRVANTNPYNEISLADAIEDQYVTRHDPKGTIMFADHRLSTITGHLPHEVYGMSAYQFIYPEDIPVAIFAQKLMFANQEKTGLVVYRLRTRNGGYVYLKSSGFVQTKQNHFVCVNKQLSEEEGARELKKFIDRFTPHINSLDAIKNGDEMLSITSSEEIKIESDSQSSGSTMLSITDSNYVCKSSPEGPNHSVVFGTTNVNHMVQCVDQKCGLVLNDTLDVDLPSRVLTNFSPLTESSSLSPQSEENRTASPLELVLDAMDSSPFDQDQDKMDELVDQDKLICSIDVINPSLLNHLGSPMCSDSIFLSNNPSPLCIAEVPTLNYWEGSPISNGSELTILPTPPHSSSDDSSKQNNSPDSSC